MVERAEREPTMEEIVVALRETRRDAGRAPPFTIVGGQPSGSWASAVSLRGGDSPVGRRYADAYDTTDIAALREGEIDRLLAENARLNDRVVFLLKVVEREQGRTVGPTVEMDRGAVVHEVKAALEMELRPVMLVLLQLLQVQQASSAAHAVSRPQGVLADRRGDR
jgi:hypothetical protein